MVLLNNSLQRYIAGTCLQRYTAGTCLQRCTAGTCIQRCTAGTCLQRCRAGTCLQRYTAGTYLLLFCRRESIFCLHPAGNFWIRRHVTLFVTFSSPKLINFSIFQISSISWRSWTFLVNEFSLKIIPNNKSSMLCAT